MRALVFAVMFVSTSAMAEEPDRLLCEFKAPHEVEGGQRYLLEIDLANGLVWSTQFLSGTRGWRTPYEMRATSNNTVIAIKKDDSGRVIEQLSMNRLTLEARYIFLTHGAAREKVWNEGAKRLGGFGSEPARGVGNVLQCRPAS